ncbi:nuclear factor erythroid 2-related factor 3 [Ascaphus truei]|uniref:nuclear factor erythroid 2-related factor 3 n=1 Tax=Ascaphus truei TaxID=8439 RepID=UPI003F5A5997
MKDLKKYLTEGLLQFTILLSLAGVRVDIDSYLPPIREIILGSSSAYSQIPFHRLRDTWHGSISLHPKSPELDSSSFFAARRLLEEVRALGGTRVPRTEVSAWLVHAVPGDAEAGSGSAAQALLSEDSSADPTTSSSSSSSEGPSQPPARSSNLHATPSQPHIGAGATPNPADYTKEKQEEKLGSSHSPYDYSYLHNENEKNVLDEELNKQNNVDENVTRGDTGIDVNVSNNLRTEINRNRTEPSLFFEEFIQLLAQTENALEGTSENALHTAQPTSRILQGNSAGELWQDFLSLPDLNIALEDMQPVSNSDSGINPSSQYSVDFTEAISQDVSLHEAMLTSNNVSRRNEDLTQRQESLLQLNSSISPEGPLSVTNLTALFPSIDNSTRNLTNHLLSGLDENVFDEINLMSLALEEGFDPLEVSQLFEEPDSDSGLSLNSSHSPTSVSISDSSSISFGEDEGAAGYSSDSESISTDGLEGAVGGSWPEHNKFCHIDYQEDSNYYEEEVTVHNVHHNHTYNQLPDHLEPSPEHHYSWPAKSSRLRSPCASSMDKNLSRDERRAKSLRIPFSVDEIVSMPVEMFNNMLSKQYLTETQVSVIRDIRRRGKNKVAAQNCRKRKLDVILNLEDDVCQLKSHKERLLKERAQCSKSVSHMKQKLNDLYRDVFSRLRDEQGRPVNQSQYALHCNSDGSIMVVPRRLFKSEQKKEKKEK